MVGEDYSKAANAVGGRTARACDSCLRRRARWFCAADDAFLCQPCDASVHGANQLAARHHRVRLRTSSFKPEDRDHLSSPAWHRGFTRKPRTPRRHKQQAKGVGGEITAPNGFLVDYPSLAVPFVPEMSGEEEEEEEESPIVDQLIVDEEGLLYQVPVFDPFAADEPGNLGQHPEEADDDDEFDHQILGFLDSELDLAEFAADVESLLGVEDKPCRRLDDVMGCKEEEGKEGDFGVGIDIDIDSGPRVVKVEEDIVDQSVLLGFQQNPSLSPETPNRPSDMLLALNYEAVIAAWDEQGSPWMTGIRPDVKPEHGWPDCVDLSPAEFRHTNNGDWGLGHNGIPRNFGEGREARVSRYREKRRTRLFSKKIRYEVRKLNAEKRPRMKGRFVKRSSTNNNNGNNKPTSTMIGSTTFPYTHE